MIDLMADIETLGRGPGCIVSQVVVKPFNINGTPIEYPEGVDPETFIFRMTLNIGEQLALGLKIDDDTLKFWMDQAAKTREEVFSGVMRLDYFLEKYALYIQYVEDHFKTLRYWATAPKLDFGCIAYLYSLKGKEYPVHFTFERCMRTFREDVKLQYPGQYKPAKAKELHNADDDCDRQIKDIQQCYAISRRVNKDVQEVGIHPGSVEEVKTI